MGTNYYARIIPKEEDKQQLIEAIKRDDFDSVPDLASELYGHRNDYSGLGGVIHLGKRSSGWKFLWNPNVIEYCDGYLDENKKYIPVYKHKYVYPLTKQGIIDFVMREDVYIVDEYKEIQDKQEFLDMAFNWCLDGLDSKEYQENPKYEASMYYGLDVQTRKKWESLGFKVEYFDFYSDGLKFSTSISFG